MATFKLNKHETINSTTTLSVSGGTTESNNYIRGGELTVQENCFLVGVGLSFDLLGAVTTRSVGIWDLIGTLLGQLTITSSNNGAYASFPAPLLLKKDQTYTLGYTSVAGDPITSGRAAPAGEYPLQFGTPKYKQTANLEKPNTTDSAWVGNLRIATRYTRVTTPVDYPPPPLVTPASKQFLIQIPPEWIPEDMRQWELQYSDSLDNSVFSDWKDLGLLPKETTIFNHTFTSLSTPAPFYRYRYKIRTGGRETDWSGNGYGGRARSFVEGSNVSGQLPPSTMPIITGDMLAIGTITSKQIYAGAIEADKIQATNIAAASITSTHIQAGAIWADHIQAYTITADQIAANAITATKIATGAIEASHIGTAQINNLHIGDNTINGVKFLDNTIDAGKILAGSITSRELATGFLDANVSALAYVTADAIKGGEIALGGTAIYQDNWASSGGDFLFPWHLEGNNLAGNVDYPLRETPPATKKFTVEWRQQKARIDVEPNVAISLGDYVRFIYRRTVATNRITKIRFHIKINIPTNFTVEMIDEGGNGRPLDAAWAKTGPSTYETSGDTETSIFTNETLPGSIGFQLRCTSNTTPGSGYYMEVTFAEIGFEKGYGHLSIYDGNTPPNVRAELTQDYIKYNRLEGTELKPSFIADADGVWVPEQGLTIGSARVDGLSYYQRDLSGNLCINSRFESLKVVPDPADPENLTTYIPSDWYYLYYNGSSASTNQTYIGTTDILPQRQSLVGGHTLVMNLQNGWDPNKWLKAISHKRYVEQDVNLPNIPLAMSVYFRCPDVSDKAKVKVRLELRYSTSSDDVTSEAQIQADTLLGYVEETGASIVTPPEGNMVLFKQVAKSPAEGGMVLPVGDGGKYVYVVIKVWSYGGTLTQNMPVEFDNVDMVIAERNTPSDTQLVADLQRRIMTLQDILVSMFSSNKAILYNYNIGGQGLEMTAVN